MQHWKKDSRVKAQSQKREKLHAMNQDCNFSKESFSGGGNNRNLIRR